jgi:hypothetical protein
MAVWTAAMTSPVSAPIIAKPEDPVVARTDKHLHETLRFIDDSRPQHSTHRHRDREQTPRHARLGFGLGQPDVEIQPAIKLCGLSIMQIRPYATADHETCLKIFRSNVPAYFDASDEPERFLDGQIGPLWVVVDNGVIVACGGVALDHPEAVLPRYAGAW